MNYRHVFHAGNFADLVKHAALTSVLAQLTAGAVPLRAIDTHAGAGLYDLTDPEARKSGEADAGIVRLMADSAAPPVFDALKAAVEACNSSGAPRRYPGSPWLIETARRPGDSLVACELRPDDFARLESLLSRPGAEALCADGYEVAPKRVQPGANHLVLIDPPFERGDEYERILACIRAVLRQDAEAVIMVWLPLKDLETFDGFLRGLEASDPPAALVAEARLRPLDDPMRMNGCALVVINDPPGAQQQIDGACRWVVDTLGFTGGLARTWRL